MRRPWMVLLASLLMVTAAPLHAAVHVTRSGSENPMQEIAKSTIYGGAAGLILGAAVAIVDDGSNSDKLKWGFAGGTFFGFGLGFYHVLSRPSGAAMIEVRGGNVRLALATPAMDQRAGLRLSIVRARF